MDKRKIAVNTGCVCLIILFIFGFYQLIQWDNTSRRGQEEAKKQKELDEAEAEEKAYERAKEYMENYRISLQESMQAAGIEDIRVSYEQYNQSTYSSVYNYWDDDPDYQYFYYELSYYCDSTFTFVQAIIMCIINSLFMHSMIICMRYPYRP